MAKRECDSCGRNVGNSDDRCSSCGCCIDCCERRGCGEVAKDDKGEHDSDRADEMKRYLRKHS